jgi:hypothetical protein
MNDGSADVEDLRRIDGWRKWVERQDRDLQDSLSLASHQFVEQSDTIFIIFEYRAMSSLSDESCEKLVSLIATHYKGKMTEWADRVLESKEVMPMGREMLMPNIAVEIAPPTTHAH